MHRDRRINSAMVIALATFAAGETLAIESSPSCPQTDYMPQRNKSVSGTSGHGFQQSWRPGKKKGRNRGK